MIHPDSSGLSLPFRTFPSKTLVHFGANPNLQQVAGAAIAQKSAWATVNFQLLFAALVQ